MNKMNCSVLPLQSTHFDSFFLEFDLDSQLFSKHHVWIVRLLECSFELVKLFLGEDRPMPSFPLRHFLRTVVMMRRLMMLVISPGKSFNLRQHLFAFIIRYTANFETHKIVETVSKLVHNDKVLAHLLGLMRLGCCPVCSAFSGSSYNFVPSIQSLTVYAL